MTVARSLVNDPTIVWADEPTGALDSETSAQIMQLLVELNRQQGQTFVLVTHDISVARRAHRIVRMRDGRIENDEQNGEGAKMAELFGIPTAQLTSVLLGVLAAGTLILAMLALRDPTSFRMAIRNVPRRKAQTALIVVGLMLATILFSAAFTTGDTLTNSFASRRWKASGGLTS